MQRLKNLLAGYPAQKIAVAFHDLTTGAEYLFAADESFHPASTFKVAVMMEAFHQAKKEALSLDDPIPAINTFQSIADGSLFFVMPGMTPTLHFMGRPGKRKACASWSA